MTHDELREQIAQDIERIMGNAQRKVLMDSQRGADLASVKAWATAVNRCLSIVRNSNDPR